MRWAKWGKVGKVGKATSLVSWHIHLFHDKIYRFKDEITRVSPCSISLFSAKDPPEHNCISYVWIFSQGYHIIIPYSSERITEMWVIHVFLKMSEIQHFGKVCDSGSVLHSPCMVNTQGLESKYFLFVVILCYAWMKLTYEKLCNKYWYWESQ